MRTPSNAATFLTGAVVTAMIGFALVLAAFRFQYGHHTIDSAGRCRSVGEKIELGRQFDAPKIVFVGGSSVHWGINAEEAGRALGREGVNFGTFAALGPEVILWEARKVLKKDDIAVLAFEYSMYGERSLTTDAISYALGCAEPFLTAMSPLEFVRTALAADPARLFHVLHWALPAGDGAAEDGPLARSRHGDPAAASFRDVSAKQQERLNLYQPLTIRIEEDSRLVRGIEAFHAWATENGVKVYATWPNTIAFETYGSNPAFDRIRTLYADEGIELLGDPLAAMYPATLFYDTQYHLSKSGIEQRTRDLISVLSTRLANEPQPVPTASAQGMIGSQGALAN